MFLDFGLVLMLLLTPSMAFDAPRDGHALGAESSVAAAHVRDAIDSEPSAVAAPSPSLRLFGQILSPGQPTTTHSSIRAVGPAEAVPRPVPARAASAVPVVTPAAQRLAISTPLYGVVGLRGIKNQHPAFQALCAAVPPSKGYQRSSLKLAAAMRPTTEPVPEHVQAAALLEHLRETASDRRPLDPLHVELLSAPDRTKLTLAQQEQRQSLIENKRHNAFRSERFFMTRVAALHDWTMRTDTPQEDGGVNVHTLKSKKYWDAFPEGERRERKRLYRRRSDVNRTKRLKGESVERAVYGKALVHEEGRIQP